MFPFLESFGSEKRNGYLYAGELIVINTLLNICIRGEKNMRKSTGYLKLLLIVFGYIFLISCSNAGKAGMTVNKKMTNGGEINGPRSIENIEENMKILEPRLLFFYEKQLKKNPELKGSIEFIFDIDEKGYVISAGIGKHTTDDPEFETKILQAISNHSFGKWNEGKGNTEVIYPLTFATEKAVEKKTANETEDIKEKESVEMETDIEKSDDTEEMETTEEEDTEEVNALEEENDTEEEEVKKVRQYIVK